MAEDKGTSVGKIHMGVEIDSEISEKDVKTQLQKISKILDKGLANLKGAFQLKGLNDAFEECFNAMNETMNEQMEAMKMNMQAFIADIKEMLANAKFSFNIGTFDKSDNESNPTQHDVKTSSPRGPPGFKIKSPKIELDQQFETEMFQQEMTSLGNTFDILSKRIDLLIAKKKELKQQIIKNEALNDASAVSKLKEEMLKLDAQLLPLSDKLEKTSITLDAMERSMQSANNVIDQATVENQTLGESIHLIGKSIGATMEQYSLFDAATLEAMTINSDMSTSLGTLGGAFSGIRGKIAGYIGSINNAIRNTQAFQFTQSLLNNTTIGQGIQSATSRISYLNSATLQAAKSHKLFGIVLNGIKTSSFGNAMSSLAGNVKSFAANLGMAALNAVQFASSMPNNKLSKFKDGIKNASKEALKFTARLLGISSASKKASSGMGHANMSIGRLVKSFVIFSLIFPLVSKGIRSLGQSISATLMTNEQFARSLDQIKSNLMASFMPIYNAVLPAINALASALANITAQIATFVSTLFGKTYQSSINAAKGMVAAKDAMGAYGSAAKKAAKDANASVMAFDHLNKLNGKNDSDSGGGADIPNIIPTDVDTSPASKLAEKIKKMFAEQDYEGIGKLIGEGINKGVAKITQFIDWSNVGGKITAVIDGFSRIFNSAVATINWDSAGKMVGTGVNTIANTIRLFFEKIDWGLLGKSLGQGLNGIVHKVDWDNIGKTIGSYFMARINGLYGFVTTADWPGIGKALADCVMGLANYVDFAKLGKLVGTGLQGAISTAHNFVNNIDWRGLGSKIASTLNNFFSSVDWGEMGLTLSKAVRGILNVFRKAIADFDFIAIGQDIADFLCNIDWLGLLLDVGVLIGRAFIGLSATIMSFISQLASNIVSGFFNGLIEFFGDIPGWIKAHIVDPFVNAIKDLFGIHSPSTVMIEIGGYLIQGLINGIANLVPTLIGNIGSWFSGIGSTIKSTWDDVKSWTHSTWDDIKSNIGGKVDNIKSNISTGFNNAKDAVFNACGNIKTSVTTKFGEVTGYLNGIKDTMYTKAKDTFEKYCGGLKSVDVKSAVTSVLDGAINWIKDLPNAAVSWGQDMMQGMANGIRGAANWVGEAANGVASKISSFLHFSRPDVGPLREYETWMPDMLQGLSKTLEKGTPQLMDSVKNLASRLSYAMQDVQPSVAFAGSTTSSEQYYNDNYVSNDEMILATLKEIVALLKNGNKSGGGTTSQEIVVKIGDTEMARVVIAAIKKYEKETGKKVLVS